MEDIYKAIKYGIKTEQPEVLSTINSKNCKNVYKLLKSNYINNKNQIGGQLLNESFNEQIILKHVVFHGKMASDRILRVPNNMFVFMPLCCGFTVTNTIDEFAFFDNEEHQIVSKMNKITKNGILHVGKKKYIVLKQHEEYCDIEIEYIADLLLEEGIFANRAKRENKDMIINVLTEIVHGENMNRVVTHDNIEFLKLLRNDKQIKEQVHSGPEPTEEEIKQYLLQTYYVINKVTNDLDRYILFSNVYGHILQKIINDKYNQIFNDFYKMLQKTKEIKKQYKLIPHTTHPEFINKFIEHVSNIIIELNLSNNDVMILKKYLFYSNIKSISPLGEFIDLCKYFYDNSETHNYAQDLTLINTNWKTYNSQLQYVSVTENNVLFKNIFLAIEHKDYISEIHHCTHVLMGLGKCIGQLCKITLMSPFEKTFLIQKYLSQAPGQVKIYLSDVLHAIHLDNPHVPHFIVNKSCQGFQEDSNVCVINRCFQKIISKLHPDVSSSESPGVFDQKDPKILVLVIKKIMENPTYQSEINGAKEKNKKLFFDLQCILHNIKIFDPDIITNVVIYYSGKKYPHVTDSLKYSLNYEQQNMEIWRTVHIKVIIAILNLFITDIYLQEPTLKTFIESKMGPLV